MGLRYLRCGGRTLTLDRTRVMGVLNVTPDSFSDGGQFHNNGFLDLGAVRARAETMVRAGAAVLDIGGESTRPGARPVGADEELDRVMPVVESLLDLDTLLCVDTSKAVVAEAVLSAGCHLINDISGLNDKKMLSVVAETDAGLCLMHMQGNPATMQEKPTYIDVVREVHDFLESCVNACRDHGLDDRRLITDPGFGFGKALPHNLELLRRLESTRVANLPILAGLSRKRMIGSLTDRSVDHRAAGSLAAALLAAERGADIVRVHDVGATVDALKVLEAVAI
ncbi:MAG: dihydropteroate synthase [Pseudomonadales bacterium]